MTAKLKQFQSNPPPAQVRLLRKSVLPVEVLIHTTSVLPLVATLSQNTGITFKVTFQQPHATTIRIDMVKNELRNEMKTSIQNSLSNQTNEIKNMMASLLQMNTASTSGSETLPGNTIANPKGELKAITTRIDYESDPRVPLILGRPFLRTARALIDVHGKEMILRNGDERLTLNMKHDTASYSNHPRRESVNLINIFNHSSKDCLEDLVSNKQSGNPTFSLHKEIASPEVIPEIHDSNGCTFLSEELPDIDSFNDIHSHFDDDPLSGSTTYSANSLLEEFADELALISYPPDYDDNRACDIESDIREIEFLLYQGEDFDFKDSIDQSVLTNCDDLFVDPTPEMFTDEQPPDYSFPPRFDVYPDDFLEIKSDATFDDDPFDSEGEKINEAELLIHQLDLPCDILSEYDSFNSQDFSRDDVLPSPDNEDKVFNPGILSHEKSVKIITRVTQEKKLAISFASWLFEDFDPPFYELLVFKEDPNSMRLLPFSSKNKEKVFKPWIYTFKKFRCYFVLELSHPSFPVFKVNLIFLSQMKIFYVQNGKNTPPLDVLLFHFYPP
nr:reverse transcriptase domain-containing protein [Tanacetum cinerariifolium]